MHFADHGVPRDMPEFRGDLAGRKPSLPELLQLLHATVGPDQRRHRKFPFLRAEQRGAAMPSLGDHCGRNSSTLAAQQRRPRCTLETDLGRSWAQASLSLVHMFYSLAYLSHARKNA